jgi:hypothetical protein
MAKGALDEVFGVLSRLETIRLVTKLAGEQGKPRGVR